MIEPTEVGAQVTDGEGDVWQRTDAALPWVCVDCDDVMCTALEEPGNDVDELKRALEHWQFHSYNSGCSHGR